MTTKPKAGPDDETWFDIPVDVDGDDAKPAETDTKKVSTEDVLCRAMYASFLESDYPKALPMAEAALELNPENTMALAVIEKCRSVRETQQRDTSRVTGEMILALTIPQRHLRLLPLDPKFVFLLSRLDGTLALQEILDACAQRLEDVNERLADLLWRGMLTRR